MIKKLSTILAACFLATLVMGAAGVANANLLTNGGFEDGVFTPWQKSGDVALVTNPSLVHSGTYGALFDNYVDSSGTVITTGGSLIQELTLDAGQYCFGVWVRIFTDEAASNYDQIQANLQVLINGTINETIRIDPNAVRNDFVNVDGVILQGTDWIHLTGIIDTSAYGDLLNANLNLNLQGQYFPGRTAVAMDDAYVEACPVPEPSTLLLLGGGLAGLAGVTWRRRKNG